MRHTDFRFALDPKLGVELLASAGCAADYPWHSHVSSCVFGLLRQGTMTLHRRRGTQTLHAGELFVLKPHEAHRLSASRPYALLNLCVDAQTLAMPGNTENIAKRLTALCRDGWLRTQEYAVLMAALERTAGTGAAMPAGSNALDELRAFLEAYPEENLSLDDMSGRIRLDKFQLIRRFRAHYGLTPHRFQMQNRLRLARRACLGAASLTDLALAAGFYDQSHFIREFRRATGVTPSQYRRAGRILPPLPLTTTAE